MCKELLMLFQHSQTIRRECSRRQISGLYRIDVLYWWHCFQIIFLNGNYTYNVKLILFASKFANILCLLLWARGSVDVLTTLSYGYRYAIGFQYSQILFVLSPVVSVVSFFFSLAFFAIYCFLCIPSLSHRHTHTALTTILNFTSFDFGLPSTLLISLYFSAGIYFLM